MNCALCKIRQADKKGSHVIPLFMIKTMVAKNTSNARGREVSFRLSGRALTSYYIGREITPEQIQESLGRDMTDEEIEGNKNHFTVDDFICTKCEESLSRLESLYCEKVESDANLFCEAAGSVILSFNEEQTLIARMLFYSIIWRICAVKMSPIKINEGIVERLRELLSVVLDNDSQRLVQNMSKYKVAINRHPLVVGKVERSNIKISQITSFDSANQAPYGFIINEYVFFFYNKIKSTLNAPQAFLGLEGIINKTSISSKGKNISLIKVDPRQYNNSSDLILKKLAHLQVNFFQEIYIELYKRVHNMAPTSIQINKCMKEILTPRTSSIDNYSINYIYEIMVKHL